MKNEEKLKLNRIIAHLDMDAFFASIEEADSPIFAGKPIAVGSDPKNGQGRGVVSTANYKAREYGIHSALPISQAWQLSQKAKAEGKPEVVFLPVDFERYNEVSEGICDIIKKYSQVVEPASIDEFYFDLSFANDFKKAEKICLKIKEEIKKKYKITCSIGLAPNKMIAKIAAGQKKPDGFVIVRQGQEEKFLESLSIREISGIGPKTGQKLNDLGINIIKDLKKFTQEQLYDLLGKFGVQLYYKVKGIDDSPLVENRQAKSIGQHETFEHDTLDMLYIGEVLESMCRNVFLRFKESGFKSFKTIGITVRFTDFKTYTTAKTFNKPFDTAQGEKQFKLEVLKLLLPYLDNRKNPDKKLIRLIGVKIEKLENTLF